jgi:HPt (histidine-containing phosphotransfer) domain-containing protein
MIDWSRIEELREEVGPEDFPEVAELFLEEAGSAVARLSGAGAGAERLGEDLHFLKGAALNLGFARVGELCAHGEERARAGLPAETGAILDAWRESRAAFLARMAPAMGR